MAQAFCRLGSNVTLLEAGPRILPQDEPEAGDLMPSRLVDDGVDLRLNAMVDRLWQNGDTIHVGMDGQELKGCPTCRRWPPPHVGRPGTGQGRSGL